MIKHPSKAPLYVQGSHGGELFHIAQRLNKSADYFLDLSSNSNIFCEDITRRIVEATPCCFAHYPDSSCRKLCARIAEHENVNADEILCGNGSAELIHLIMHTIKPRHVLMIAPIFSEYVNACRAAHCEYTLFSPSDDTTAEQSAKQSGRQATVQTARHNTELGAEQGFDLLPHDIERLRRTVAKLRPDMLILCTPNNPACITYPRMQEILRAAPCPHVLIDNSYKEFMWGEPTWGANGLELYRAALPAQTHLITLHSLTKFFYCTGIRLGYIISDATAIANLAEYKVPWSVWNFAEELGIKFLDAVTLYRERLPAMRRARAHFAAALRQSPLFDSLFVFEGASFVIARVQTGKRDELGDPKLSGAYLQQAILQRGIIARLCDNIPGMPPHFLRFQVRDDAAQYRIMTALEEIARRK